MYVEKESAKEKPRPRGKSDQQADVFEKDKTKQKKKKNQEKNPKHFTMRLRSSCFRAVDSPRQAGRGAGAVGTEGK